MEKLYQCFADSNYNIELNDVVKAQNEEEARAKFVILLNKHNLKYGDVHVWELESVLKKIVRY